jgi:hypothetical protein
MHAFKTMHDEKVSALPILGFKNPDVFESEDKMILKVRVMLSFFLGCF